MLLVRNAVVAAIAVVGVSSVSAFGGGGAPAIVTGNTTGGPTWHRTVGGTPPTSLHPTGTAVPYTVTPFTVDATGNYLLEGSYPTGYDGYLHLYQNAFNPLDQFTNVLSADDDFSGAFTVLPGSSASNAQGSQILPLPLTAGVTYLAVVSGFGNLDFGPYTLGIGNGPGNVTIVPEPTSLAAIGAGAVALLARRRAK